MDRRTRIDLKYVDKKQAKNMCNIVKYLKCCRRSRYLVWSLDSIYGSPTNHTGNCKRKCQCVQFGTQLDWGIVFITGFIVCVDLVVGEVDADDCE